MGFRRFLEGSLEMDMEGSTRLIVAFKDVDGCFQLGKGSWVPGWKGC